jgi:hypothetical protein
VAADLKSRKPAGFGPPKPIDQKECPTALSKQSTSFAWLRRLLRRRDFSHRVSPGRPKPFEQSQFHPLQGRNSLICNYKEIPHISNTLIFFALRNDSLLYSSES